MASIIVSATASISASGTSTASGTITWEAPSFPEDVKSWDSVVISGSWAWTGKGNILRVSINNTNTYASTQFSIALDADVSSPLTITCVGGNKNSTGSYFTWSNLQLEFFYTVPDVNYIKIDDKWKKVRQVYKKENGVWTLQDDSIPLSNTVQYNRLGTQTATWDRVFASIDAGTYAQDYYVGFTIPLDLGEEGIFDMEIIAFDADTLADGSGKAPISWLSKQVTKTPMRMNPYKVQNEDGTYQVGTGTIGGWQSCEARTYIKSLKSLMPTLVSNRIVSVQKSDRGFNTNGELETWNTTDDIWLPGTDEFFSNGIYSNWGSDVSNLIKYYDDTNVGSYYLRTTDRYNIGYFYLIYTDGTHPATPCTNIHRFAFGFCT